MIKLIDWLYKKAFAPRFSLFDMMAGALALLLFMGGKYTEFLYFVFITAGISVLSSARYKK